MKTVICPHCKNNKFEKPYTETMYEKGTDDPQYGGELITVNLKECTRCGELIEFQ